jgi:hypothetical protein
MHAQFSLYTKVKYGYGIMEKKGSDSTASPTYTYHVIIITRNT